MASIKHKPHIPKRQKFYTLRKDYVMKIEKGNKILKEVWQKTKQNKTKKQN